MREQGLEARHLKRWKKTTIPDPGPDPLAVDLVGRRFQPEELALNACWAGDITYVRTWEGWMYLATVIDLASRRVVGWAMADHMRADLVCEALEMALSWRRPVARLIFHSDRGSQNNSARFRQLLAAHGIRQSLSRPRQVWDNAVVEAFYSTLKVELVHRYVWATRALARQAISTSSRSSTTGSACTRRWRTARRPNMKLVCQVRPPEPHSVVVCRFGAGPHFERCPGEREAASRAAAHLGAAVPSPCASPAVYLG